MLDHYVAHEEHKLRVQRIEKNLRHDQITEPKQKASRIQLVLEALNR